MSKKDLFERDFRDICYFIDHVTDVNLRVDLLRSLGYKVGVNIVTNNSKEKEIVIGHRNEKRIQVAPVIKGFPLVTCIILN